jgi:hypothetical protein
MSRSAYRVTKRAVTVTQPKTAKANHSCPRHQSIGRPARGTSTSPTPVIRDSSTAVESTTALASPLVRMAPSSVISTTRCSTDPRPSGSSKRITMPGVRSWEWYGSRTTRSPARTDGPIEPLATSTGAEPWSTLVAPAHSRSQPIVEHRKSPTRPATNRPVDARGVGTGAPARCSAPPR